MKKVSDYARERLNQLVLNCFLLFCIAVAVLMIVVLMVLPVKMINISGNMVEAHIIGSMFIFLFWLFGRGQILTENKKDTRRKWLIEGYRTDIVSMNVRTNEKWLDKKLKSVHIANTEEMGEIRGHSFYHEIILNKQGDRENIREEVKTGVYFSPTLSGNTIEMNGIDYLAFLPYPNETKNLLVKIFDFTKVKYCQQKNLSAGPDYTLKAIEDVRNNIIECIDHLLSEDYQTALKIFLSEEEFEIAGRTIESDIGKKLFLITAIKTEGREIVLFPEKTIADTTAILHIALN